MFTQFSYFNSLLSSACHLFVVAFKLMTAAAEAIVSSLLSSAFYFFVVAFKLVTAAPEAIVSITAASSNHGFLSDLALLSSVHSVNGMNSNVSSLSSTPSSVTGVITLAAAVLTIGATVSNSVSGTQLSRSQLRATITSNNCELNQANEIFDKEEAEIKTALFLAAKEKKSSRRSGNRKLAKHLRLLTNYIKKKKKELASSRNAMSADYIKTENTWQFSIICNKKKKNRCSYLCLFVNRDMRYTEVLLLKKTSNFFP